MSEETARESELNPSTVDDERSGKEEEAVEGEDIKKEGKREVFETEANKASRRNSRPDNLQTSCNEQIDKELCTQPATYIPTRESSASEMSIDSRASSAARLRKRKAAQRNILKDSYASEDGMDETASEVQTRRRKRPPKCIKDDTTSGSELDTGMPDMGACTSKHTNLSIDHWKENRKKDKSSSASNKPGKKRIKKKKNTSPENLQENLSRSATSNETGEPGMRSLTASALCAMALEHLEEIEVIRSKSRNLKGELTGKIKKNLISVKQMVAILVEKADAQGDPSFLRMRNNELQIKNKELKCEIKTLKAQGKRTMKLSTAGVFNKEASREVTSKNDIEKVVVTSDIKHLLHDDKRE